MEKVNIVGVDPSLRSTGIAILSFDTEKKIISVPHHCQVLVNPQKYTGKDAILNMLEMMQNTYNHFPEYQNADAYIIESPGIMYNKNWSSSTLSLISHVAGGAAVVFGIEKVHLFRPNEWNKNRRKEVTHHNTTTYLSDPETWEFCCTLKSDKYIEHILDAVSLALFRLRNQYWEETEQ